MINVAKSQSYEMRFLKSLQNLNTKYKILNYNNDKTTRTKAL